MTNSDSMNRTYLRTVGVDVVDALAGVGLTRDKRTQTDNPLMYIRRLSELSFWKLKELYDDSVITKRELMKNLPMTKSRAVVWDNPNGPVEVISLVDLDELPNSDSNSDT